MIRAGALTYAVFVMVVAAILCSLMIMLAFANRNYFFTINTNEHVKDLAYSGLAWSMAGAEEKMAPFEEATYKQRNGNHLWFNTTDTLMVKQREWGAFKVHSSGGRRKGYHYNKGVFTACTNERYKDMSLYMADFNRPLKLAGDALIKGDAWLPEKGVEGAYIEGSNYKRSELVYGKKKTSGKKLAPIEKWHKQYTRDYLQGHFLPYDSVVGMGELPDVLNHSFLKATVTVAQPTTIDLDYQKWRGNVIVYSGTGIKVKSTTELKDVVLVAPKVVIEKGVKGNFHILASDSVIIQEGVNLEFPSSISMAPAIGNDSHCAIRKGAMVNGLLVSYSEKKQKTNNVNVTVAEGATVRGMVYTEDNLEIRGVVQGQVFCNRFLLKTGSGVYENHLLDGKIDRSKVGQPLVGMDMVNEESEVLPVKWFAQ